MNEFQKIWLKHQQTRIDNLLANCKNKFTKNKYQIRKIFSDVVCGLCLSADATRDFIMEDFDAILATKENADIFFSFYTNPDFIWYEHYLGHWGEQTIHRKNVWITICNKLDSYCQKYYHCNWGKQHVEFVEPIPPYRPLSNGYLKENNMKNRPLYFKDTLIGYVKKIVRMSIIVGYHSEVDEVDDDYYENVPDYRKYKKSILFYGQPHKIPNLNFYEKDGCTYILEDNLDNYTVLEDRIILK